MIKTRYKIVKYIILLPIILVFIFYITHINQFIIVTSKSMMPYLNTGDLVYYEPIFSSTQFDEISADPASGDIVVLKGARYFYDHGVDPFLFAYLSENVPIVHRAIHKYYNESIKMWFFITKGDNNEYSDGCVRGIIEDGYAEFSLNQSNPMFIPQSEILGLVKFVIPKLGYIGMYFSLIFGITSIIIIGIIMINLFGYQIKILKSKTDYSR